MDAKKSQTPGGDRAARVAALCSLLEALRRDVVVTVSTPEGEELASWELAAHGKAEPARPGPPGREPAEPPAPKKRPRNLQLRGLILQILEEAEPARLSGPEVYERLRKHPEYQGWAWKTAERALLAMRDAELIDNDTDGRGTGYGQL